MDNVGYQTSGEGYHFKINPQSILNQSVIRQLLYMY